MPPHAHFRASQSRSPFAGRRGGILVAMIVVLIVLSIIVAAISASNSNAQRSAVLRVRADQAKQAADTAANLAIKELIDNSDHDSDGGVGSISNDANAANDPTLNSTRLWATRSDSGGIITITARSQNDDARRALQLSFTPPTTGTSPSADELFFTDDSPSSVRRSAFSSSTSTWGAASASGTTAAAPIWAAAAAMDDATLVVASNASTNGLYAGVADASGVGTYASICSNTGYAASRAFDAAAEGLTRRGIVAYFDSAAQVARYRTATGTTISAAASIGIPINVTPHFSTASLPWIRLVSLGPATNEAMVFTTHSCRCVWAARWTGSAWTDFTHMTGDTGLTTYCGVDAAVEALSGRLVAVCAELLGDKVGTKVYTPGSGWSAVTYRTGFGDDVQWVRLAAVPGTNTLFLAAMTGDRNVRVCKWNGSAWSTPTAVVSDTGDRDYRGFDLSATPDGTKVMVMYGKSTSTVYYRTWTGAAWTAEATAFTLSSGAQKAILMRPGPSGTTLIGAVGDDNGGVNAWSWNGTSFGAVNRVGVTTSSYKEYEWFAIPVEPGATTSAKLTAWTSIAP